MTKMNQHYNKIITAAIHGGIETMEIYNKPIDFHEKSDGSPVTIADVNCEKIIFEHLQNSEFKLPFIGEETLDLDKVTEEYKKYYCVDPLDGTKEFIKKNGEFTVNIGLIEDKFPVFGVIYAPALDLLYFGGKDIGSYCMKDPQIGDDFFEKATKIEVKKHDNVHAITSRSHRDEQTENFLKKNNIENVIGAGSSLKFCYISDGKADIYPRFGRTMEWDTSAGQAIVEGAGGYVVDAKDLKRLSYFKKERGFDNPSFLAFNDSSFNDKKIIE